jgi:predicted Rossmann fold nucleotide-binding protein DprA/Smf involved in DNA uptake
LIASKAALIVSGIACGIDEYAKNPTGVDNGVALFSGNLS